MAEEKEKYNRMDYETVVNQNIDIVYRTALSYCKNTYDAEEVVQNTFAKFLQTDTTFQDETHIRKWLVRVAVNECKNMWKSFWRKNVSSIDDLNFEPEYKEKESKKLLDEVFKLPPKYRIVIHLYYYEGYSVKEIASLLNISISNVQIRLMRARNKLKNQIEEE